MLSPHAHTQTEAVVGEPDVHEYPEIMPLQVAKQPFPSDMFPSSQVSVPTTLPSPQIGEQISGIAPLQLNPVSF